MKFVVWGTGERGRRLYQLLGDEYLVASIDKDKDKNIEKLPLISIDEYKKEYADYPIIISVMYPKAIERELLKNGIDLYFNYVDTPGALQEPYQRNYWREYVYDYLKKNKKYELIGNNLYTFLIADIAKRKGVVADIRCDSTITKSYQRFVKENGLRLSDKKNYDETLYCDYCSRDKLMSIGGTYFFDIEKNIKQYKHPELKNFYNLKHGESCFIVATGPSLRIEDLDVLKENHVDTFSLNSIYYAFHNTTWRPTFFVAEDYSFFRDEINNLEYTENTVYFFGDTDNKNTNREMRSNEFVYHVDYIRRDNERVNFSDDISACIYPGGTVVYSCMQIAAYMGYEKIYLLGVDFSYSNDKQKKCYGHFYKEKKLTAKPATEWVYNAYLSAQEYVKDKNIHIYNATRGGNLEIFERVSFDDLF